MEQGITFYINHVYYADWSCNMHLSLLENYDIDQFLHFVLLVNDLKKKKVKGMCTVFEYLI